jgi:hypothetical protein
MVSDAEHQVDDTALRCLPTSTPMFITSNYTVEIAAPITHISKHT